MAGEFVSIIMPAYNAEKYIDASIRFVLAQTYSDWELILADHGSGDGTAGIVNEFVARDRRIKCLLGEQPARKSM